MKKIGVFSFCFLLLLAIVNAHFIHTGLNGPLVTVNRIHKEVPDDLSSEVLIIALYDQVSMPDAPMTRAERNRYKQQLARINKAANEGNEVIREIMKDYPYQVKFVSLREVEHYKSEGYRYFLDLVWMPKQFTDVRREAMVPAYQKFSSANKMFSNVYAQFHYYFYIRDLNNDDAYITSRLKGYPDAYKGMEQFIKQVKKDLKQ